MLVDLACFIKIIFDSRLAEQFEEASMHLWELLEERDKAVAGTTCKQYYYLVFLDFAVNLARQLDLKYLLFKL